VLDPLKPGFQYETLGRIIRTNVVRGDARHYQRGVTQTDFNESVFDPRRQTHQQEQTTTSEHHKRRDDLSRWLDAVTVGCPTHDRQVVSST